MRPAPCWIYNRCTPRFFLFPTSLIILPRRPQATIASPGALSPAVLNCARTVAAEHARLSQDLARAFDICTAKRARESARVAVALHEWEKANESVLELRGLLDDRQTDPELRQLAEGDLPSIAAQLDQASQSLTRSLVPQHPFAHLPCMIEIRPGAGGSEAALFAADLLRMYQAYCYQRGLRTRLLKYEDSAISGDPRGDGAALQEAILEITDKGAYGRFRVEAGVHRVQRVPATEAKGRTHTSSASVLVLPSLFETSNAGLEGSSDDHYIDPKDVRTDIMRAGGAGGQHVNKTESAVRLTHLPTATVAAIQDSRSQRANKDQAWQVLRSRVAQLRRETREAEALNLRRSVIGVAKMGREHKIRTYNWGQQRVTDHRSGLTIMGLGNVINGGEALDDVMESVRQWMDDRDVQQKIALQGGTESK